MCGTCGCDQGEKRVENLNHRQAHDHPHAPAEHTAEDILDHGPVHPHAREHAHWHEHSYTSADSTVHSHPHGHAHPHVNVHKHPHRHSAVDESAATGAAAARLLSVEQDLLARNDAIAARNRHEFHAVKTLTLNLVSSPGSGKTTLLVETLKRLGAKYPVGVIEGDQETTADSDRIRATGAPAIQINTGKGCHLDAVLVRTAMHRLGVPASGILFIENVGNLVCPAGFDLGEAHKVVIVSVTEGEDKPLKYSGMFAASALMVVTKIDLLPHLDLDIERLIANARRINPTIGILKLSAKSGEGMERWMHWLETARALRMATD
jgi:hydrogenase nickel incorporation protein HypB